MAKGTAGCPAKRCERILHRSGRGGGRSATPEGSGRFAAQPWTLEGRIGLNERCRFDMVLLRHMKGPLEEPRLGRSRRPVRRNVTVAATGQASVSGNALVAKHPEAFSYDADGNLTQDGRWHYTWDGENRLVRMSSANTNPAVGPQQWVEFEYDWQGRRISKKVGAAGSGVATNDLRFVYDGWNLVAILNSDFSLFTSFAWGLDLSGTMQGAGGVGGLLWMTVPSGANAGTYFYAYDGNGNVMALVSAADGSVAARYEYGPFGELIRATGPMAKLNPFRFSTKYQDEETGLVCYGVRYLKTSTGEWLSRDPIGERGGLNLYGFVGNDAIRRIDPFGLDYYIYIVKGTCGVNHRVLVGDDGNGNSYEIDIQPLAKKWYQSYRRVCGKGVISYTPRTGAATNWISGKLEKHGDTTPAQDAAMAAKAKSMDNASITYCLGIQDCRAIEDCLLWGPVGQRISDQLQLLWEVIVEQISPPR